MDNTLNEQLLIALQDVEDPEFPMSVVDMGLIYGLSCQNGRVSVDLTFTAMGCPGMQYLIDDIETRLLKEDGVEEVEINVVWSPPWTADRLSEAGRQVLIDWGIGL